MIGLILSALGGGLGNQLRRAYEAKLNAKNDADRLAAEVTVKPLEARVMAQTQGQGAWLSKAVQAAWAAPFIIFAWKVIVWDKVLGWGVTDPLGPLETDIGRIIVAFYFLTTGVHSIVSRFRR